MKGQTMFNHVESEFLRTYLGGTPEAFTTDIHAQALAETVDACEADESGIDHGLSYRVLDARIAACDQATEAFAARDVVALHGAIVRYWGA
jgi:hypothetical protein